MDFTQAFLEHQPDHNFFLDVSEGCDEPQHFLLYLNIQYLRRGWIGTQALNI